MTAGAVAAAVVSAPARSIGTRRHTSAPARLGRTPVPRGPDSTEDPGFADDDDARWDTAWTSVRDASTRVAFIDGDARRALRARLRASESPRSARRDSGGGAPARGGAHGRERGARGRSGHGPHGGLFGHVDAGATDDGVRRGIETLERDIADVVRSFGKTWARSAVVQVSLLRKTLCSSTTWTGCRCDDGDLLRRWDGGAVGGRQHAITRARALGPFAEDLAKSLAAAAAVHVV